MEAPQLESVKQNFIDEEVVIITAGKSWGQPYSCEQWATNFGLTIPILDDESGSLAGIFGNSIPHNVVINGNGQIVYTSSGHNLSNIINVIAVIGPCIRYKNYEVKSDFKKKFLKKYDCNECFVQKNSIIYFDLSKFIKKQLRESGIKNIEIIKKDTFTRKNKFYSARYSLKKNYNDYGRNISLIMIK